MTADRTAAFRLPVYGGERISAHYARFRDFCALCCACPNAVTPLASILLIEIGEALGLASCRTK
jgi:hypothetical protein